MRRSPKLLLYAGFAAATFFLALVFGRPEIAALGAPFALFLVVGLSLGAPPKIQAALRLQRERVLEGEETEAELTLTSSVDARAVHVALSLPQGVRVVGGNETALVRLEGSRERSLRVRLDCRRWGAYRLGDMLLRSEDRTGLRFVDAPVRGDTLLKVYPRPERLQRLVAPKETQPFAGNRVGRVAGEGIEFAGLRPYSPGDRLRRINWRASSGRKALVINQQHPEQNSDVVIFLDSFAEARGREEGTLDMTVRGAASLAEHYLSSRDRVGLVSFGGMVRWLAPVSGSRQIYHIVEALLQTEIALSFVWKGIEVLPRGSLTPQALVIALSPLLDERSVGALLDLRRRGFDLVVVDVSPLAFVAEEHGAESTLALRLWRLWREALRFRYEQLGVAVVEWDGTVPLAAVVEEVRAFRRLAHYLSA
ncbi:MAG: DUF58 domain-containing protein [Armatimonadetes bacterium]|nr:DUF58 domain-containing protein [Armatimonadota bacterium]